MHTVTSRARTSLPFYDERSPKSSLGQATTAPDRDLGLLAALSAQLESGTGLPLPCPALPCPARPAPPALPAQPSLPLPCLPSSPCPACSAWLPFMLDELSLPMPATGKRFGRKGMTQKRGRGRQGSPQRLLSETLAWEATHGPGVCSLGRGSLSSIVFGHQQRVRGQGL